MLGICLGMQLLFASSEEGDRRTPCLGIIAGRVERLPASPERPVPHMGWNRLRALREDPLLEGIARGRLLLLRAQLRRAGRRAQPRR